MKVSFVLLVILVTVVSWVAWALLRLTFGLLAIVATFAFLWWALDTVIHLIVQAVWKNVMTHKQNLAHFVTLNP